MGVLYATRELHIFFLNAWGHPAFHRSYQKHIDYITEFCLFVKYFLQQRYQNDAQVHIYWPAPSTTGKIKTYADVQKFDTLSWVHDFSGQRLQLYCGYGLDLRPHEEELKELGYPDPNAKGYCECMAGRFSGDVELKKEDMMYVDLPAYETTGFWGPRSIYEQLSDFSRSATHELEHQILLLTRHPAGHIRPVHRAAKKPPIKWAKTSVGYTRGLEPRQGDVFFMSQIDPRTV